MQLANVTARLLASLKGHRDQENLFEQEKASNFATFKNAQKKIWRTAGCSALLQSPGMLQNKSLWKVFQAQEIPGDGEQPGQCQFIKGTFCLMPTVRGRGSVAEGTPEVPFTLTPARLSLVWTTAAWQRIQTTGWMKNLGSTGLKTLCGWSLTIRWFQVTSLSHQN